MDVKGLVRSLVPFAQTAEAVAKRKRTETGSASDRDANGRQEQAEEEKKRHLSPEEIQEAIKHLESLPGVKDNNLRVELVEESDIKTVYIKDSTDKVVRRFAEADLHVVLKNKSTSEQKKSGQLLNKSA